MSARELHLNLFIHGVGHHEAAWRSPHARAEVFGRVDYFTGLARTAEAGLLDSLFFADLPVLASGAEFDMHQRWDPTLLLAHLAATTQHIGLVATASTTYNEPFTLARQFATLDHLSGGRAGWNAVTTSVPRAAANFSRSAHPDHADRYEVADEFLEVVLKLWDSWDADAIVADQETGRYLRPGAVREIGHDGTHFHVQGALNVDRCPQGRPLIFQAGSSESGLDHAARFADAIFTTQHDLDGARTFVADLRRRVVARGRDPYAIKVLPGLVPITAATTADARELATELAAFTSVELGFEMLKNQLGGLDLSDRPLDEPFPDLTDILPVNGPRHRAHVIATTAARDGLTLRQVLHWLAGGHGHRVVVASHDDLADEIARWFETDAADGFNIMPAALPSGLDTFVGEIVPRLRAKGIFRTSYTAQTLRERYGLAPIGAAPRQFEGASHHV